MSGITVVANLQKIAPPLELPEHNACQPKRFTRECVIPSVPPKRRETGAAHDASELVIQDPEPFLVF